MDGSTDTTDRPEDNISGLFRDSIIEETWVKGRTVPEFKIIIGR